MAAVPYTIPQCIEIAQISQVLLNRDILAANFSTNQVLDKRHPRILYMERKALEWYYIYGTNATTLSDIANYVLALCGRYVQQALNIIGQLAQSPPILSGPTNLTVNEGQDATFSVTVTSSLPVTYQWYLNGSLVIEATSSTYTIPNAQLTDSGDVVFVRVTNAAGTATSTTATLTVTALIIGYFYQGGNDYSGALQIGTDNVPYLGTFNITSGQPLLVSLPHIGAQEFVVIKYPNTESTKVQYENPPGGFDTGPIPSLPWDDTTITTWKYIFSRSGNPFALNNTTGQIKYS